ncbi:MAG TPA: S-adenosylmethionine:tRNA ribosyltransferase-isomerase, partial [Chloroflexota bacterium]
MSSSLRASDFDYVLPERLIAQRPLERRDECRLLVLGRRSGEVSHRRFDDLPALLRPGDLLVVNDTRVLPARLYGRKPTGGRVELLLTRRLGPDAWLALAHPGLRVGQVVRIGEALHAEVTAIEPDGQRTLRFDRSGAEPNPAARDADPATDANGNTP